MITTVNVWVHGDKDSLWETGEQLGLTDKDLRMFIHSCDEFKLELEVDALTGKTKVISIDGRKVED